MRLTENQKSKLIVDIINEGEYWEKKGVPTKQIELIIETSISDIRCFRFYVNSKKTNCRLDLERFWYG